MLIPQWTINWGDGSDPQTVSPQPWVVHQYPAAGQYTDRVTATSPDGTYSGRPRRPGSRTWSASAVRATAVAGRMTALPPTLHVAAAQTVAQGQTFALDNLASFSYPDAADGQSGLHLLHRLGRWLAPLNGSNVDILAPGGERFALPGRAAERRGRWSAHARLQRHGHLLPGRDRDGRRQRAFRHADDSDQRRGTDAHDLDRQQCPQHLPATRERP